MTARTPSILSLLALALVTLPARVTLPALGAQNAPAVPDDAVRLNAPAGEDLPGADELWSDVSNIDRMARDGGAVYFRDHDERYCQVLQYLGGDFVVQADFGRTFLDLWRLIDGGAPRLAEWAKRYRELSGGEVELGEEDEVSFLARPLLGDCFGTDDLFFETSGEGASWRLEEFDVEGRDPDVAELFTLIERAALKMLAVRGATADPRVQSVLAVLSDALPEFLADEPLELNFPAETTEMSPAAIRRMLRGGWLQKVLSDKALAESILEGLEDAEQLTPFERYVSSDGRVLELLGNAFGEEVWRLSTKESVQIAVSAPEPFYREGDTMLGSGWVEYSFGAGVDPLAAGAVRDADVARLVIWGREFARLENGEFSASDELWDDFVREPEDLDVGQPLSNPLPPHLVLVGPGGNLHGLALAGGVLHPSAGAGDAERFLEDAARLLDSAAELDLLGQYLFHYAYDTPVLNEPWLVGTPDQSADIQLTAVQTVANCSGGEMRGDCDDLTALCIEILRRQGRFAMPMGSPEHVSALFVEQQEDDSDESETGEEWAAWIVQTGPTLEFRAPTLEGALDAAYRSQDPNRPFDREHLLAFHPLGGDVVLHDVHYPVEVFTDPDLATRVLERANLKHIGAFALAVDQLTQAAQNGASVPELIELGQLFEWQRRDATALAAYQSAIEMANGASRARARAGALRCATRLGNSALADRLFGQLLGVDLAGMAARDPLLVRSEFVTGELWEAIGDDLAPLRVRLFESVVLPGLDPALGVLERELELDDAPARDPLVPDRAIEPYGQHQLSLHAFLSMIEVSYDVRHAASGLPSVDTAAYERQLARLARWVFIDSELAEWDPEEAEEGEDEVGYPPLPAWQRWLTLGLVGDRMLQRGAAFPVEELEWPASSPRRDLAQRVERADGMLDLESLQEWGMVSPICWVMRIDRLLRCTEQRPSRERVQLLWRHYERSADLLRSKGDWDSMLAAFDVAARWSFAVAADDRELMKATLEELVASGDSREADFASDGLAYAARWFDADGEAWQEVLQLWEDGRGGLAGPWDLTWAILQRGYAEQALAAARIAAKASAGDSRFAGNEALIEEAVDQLLARRKASGSQK